MISRRLIVNLIAFFAVSFGLVIWRLPLLRARNDLDSWVSREAAFLVNNWVLLSAAFFILVATLFPTLSEAITRNRVTVGPPFFNKWMAAIGLIMLFLTGVGPLIALILDDDLEAFVQEGELAETIGERIERECRLLEDFRVGLEADDRPVLRALFSLGERTRGHPVLVALGPHPAAPTDLQVEPFAQRIDHGDAHPVEPARMDEDS